MKRLIKSFYGWVEPNLYEEGGWILEGGEEKYNEACVAFENHLILISAKDNDNHFNWDDSSGFQLD